MDIFPTHAIWIVSMCVSLHCLLLSGDSFSLIHISTADVKATTCFLLAVVTW
ncbi:hypothetical protein L873DRAFT_1818752 [Choiromyces venosus 120613-1]|uniref:Uncharacterized protein n=1 Tax=Choiromyces venosus 120613-1 TaxID=1336337 RepID=A0A3N4J5Y4_9PEZI|nr:hypothetical protein L873DRAFT_1818752 [Choiromyces venosus 120613-1]